MLEIDSMDKIWYNNAASAKESYYELLFNQPTEEETELCTIYADETLYRV